MKEKDIIFSLCLILLGIMVLLAVMFFHVRAAERYVAEADQRCNDYIAEWVDRNPGLQYNTLNLSTIEVKLP